MSLFGGGSSSTPAVSAPKVDASLFSGGGAAGSSTGGKDDKKGDETFQGFDPRGLERAAKAAKELDASKNAAKALELGMKEAEMKRTQAEAEAAKSNAIAQEQRVRQIREEGEQQRQTIDFQNRSAREQADYNDRLARERHKWQKQEDAAAQAWMADKEREKQEAFTRRMEEEKRETLRHEAELRRQTEVSREREAAKGRAWQERENWKLHLEREELRGKQYRETVLESVKTAGAVIGEGVRDFLADPKKMTTAVGLLSAAALGVYGARAGTGLAARAVESRIGKPALVRETTRGFSGAKKGAGGVLGSLFSKGAGPDAALSGVIVEDSLESRLRRLATSTFNTRKNRAMYRHALLYGPPGTGKTMFAKQLAKTSNMDYAILTGADVAPLGKDAVTELHKLFDWANTSSSGLLLFIDEADAFLRTRDVGAISEDMRNALNAFLYRTGTQTSKFMVVMASNQPQQLDPAIHDRIDEAIHFTLPTAAERGLLLRQYFDAHVGRKRGSGMLWWRREPIIVALDTDTAISGGATPDEEAREAALAAALASVVPRSEGWSGRQIEKLAVALQAAAYASEDRTLTRTLFDEVVAEHAASFVARGEWEAAAERA